MTNIVKFSGTIVLDHIRCTYRAAFQQSAVAQPTDTCIGGVLVSVVGSPREQLVHAKLDYTARKEIGDAWATESLILEAYKKHQLFRSLIQADAARLHHEFTERP
jgi:hypothetical protein